MTPGGRPRAPGGESVPPRRDDVTGIVLAGGQGTRMGGADKGLLPFRGAPMIAAAIARFAPQVRNVVVSANRNADAYAALGHRVVHDEIGGYAGPLAGLHAGLGAVETRYAATVPCDSPFLPLDLVRRLREGLDAAGADIAVARTLDGRHPVFALLRASLRPHLGEFLAAGGRKVDAWMSTLAVAEVSFDDEADAFRNLNTRDEISAAGG